VNLPLLLQTLAGKPTCIRHRTARIHAGARVVNMGRSSDLIRIGARTVIRGELLVFPQGGEITIGDWGYVGEGTRIWSAARISLGNRVLVSHNVTILDSLTHPIDAGERHRQVRAILTHGHPYDVDLGARAVSIGDDAWVGAGAIVLRGLRIGRGAIVGAGSVVTHDVPDWTVVAGNPARAIRKISDPKKEDVDK
jgi:acetyltransferase-like isoleucine patch superfamily enzyme